MMRIINPRLECKKVPFPFFANTRSTINSLTSIFDFIWPTAAAMWNLRWQVKGFLEICPNTDELTLAGRFVAGSGVNGTNLRRTCIEQTWVQQQERFAELLLTSLFALYESWCERSVEMLHCTSSEAAKRLQFPTGQDPTGKNTKGVGEVLDRLAASDSQMMIQLIYPKLVSHPKFSLPYLDKYLVCYRYFKEVRNCLIHKGGIADQKCVDAYSEFAKIPNAAAIGLKEFPHHSAAQLDQPITVSLRGVVGFSDILLRLIITLDAVFAKHHQAEKLVLEKWKESHFERYVLPANPTARAARLQQLIGKLDWKATRDTQALESLLKKHSLCR
jgi:hypothetical protein